MKVKSRFEMLLCGTWLITCTVLLAAFSGQLRELVIKPKPVYTIDNWQNLSDWKNVAIQAGNGTELVTSIRNNTNDFFPKEFIERLEFRNDSDEYLISKLDKERLKSGKLAIICPIDILQIIKKNLTDDGLIEDIDFHISTNGSDQQYFSLINTVNETLLPILNHGY